MVEMKKDSCAITVPETSVPAFTAKGWTKTGESTATKADANAAKPDTAAKGGSGKKS